MTLDEHEKVLETLDLAIKVIHTRTHKVSCSFSGCTCMAANDFAKLYTDFCRSKEELLQIIRIA